MYKFAIAGLQDQIGILTSKVSDAQTALTAAQADLDEANAELTRLQALEPTVSTAADNKASAPVQGDDHSVVTP